MSDPSIPRELAKLVEQGVIDMGNLPTPAQLARLLEQGVVNVHEARIIFRAISERLRAQGLTVTDSADEEIELLADSYLQNAPAVSSNATDRPARNAPRSDSDCSFSDHE